MAGISRFRKGNNPISNANKGATTETAHTDESANTIPGNDTIEPFIQDQNESNDNHQDSDNINAAPSSSEETGNNALSSSAAESMHLAVESSHFNHPQKEAFESTIEYQESHFDIATDSIVDMDICDLNFTGFENDDSILPYSDGDGFHVHDGFQNDNEEEKEQVSQSSCEIKSSSGLRLFRNRKKPLEHTEGGKENETFETVDSTNTTTEEAEALHDEKDQEQDARRHILNNQVSNEDESQRNRDENSASDESSASSEPQNQDQHSASNIQVSDPLGKLLNDNNDMEMENVETEKEMETEDVIMNSFVDVTSISHESKISSIPTEPSIEIKDDETTDKTTASVVNAANESVGCIDAVSTTHMDKGATETPHFGICKAPSSVQIDRDDTSNTSGDSKSINRSGSSEGLNNKPFGPVTASQRILPMPPPPRNTSNEARSSVQQTRPIDPTMPAPNARDVLNRSRAEPRPPISVVIPESSAQSFPRIIPGMNQTPARPRTTAFMCGNSTNSMTSLSCSNEAMGVMNPVTPSPGSNQDKSSRNSITPESRTVHPATHQNLIPPKKQLANNCINTNHNGASHNEKEARFDVIKDKFEKDIVESNDAWDRSDAELIELNVSLVIMDNMALRLHGHYGELLEEIEELLVS